MNKKEYVERDSLLAEYKRLLNKLAYLKDTFTYRVIQLFVARLENEPAADVVEVRHGKWIVKNNERDWQDQTAYRLSIECSRCGKTHFLGTTKYQNEYDKEKLKELGNYADYSYCSKCGAKMDGGK